MSPKRDTNPTAPCNPRVIAQLPDDRRDSVEEALLILSRMLGRQAARDWLSVDIYSPETADDA